MPDALIAGFSLGGSLIGAIGAQNAFVIRQGALNAHVFWICLFCAVSDAVLIWGGTFGLAAILAAVPALASIMRYGGAAFLFCYGVVAFRRALKPAVLVERTDAPQSLKSALVLCSAFTWANPHVYLDTVALVGAVANSRAVGEQVPFATGASLASFIWFFGIGYGAKALRDPLSRPAVWAAIDFGIAAVMIWLAWRLLTGI